MPAPDIEALQQRIRAEEALANASVDPYDDRQGYARARAQDARYRADQLKRELAALQELRKAALAAIHAAAKRLGLDDDTYRALLRECAGVNSAADLDAAGRMIVLQRLGARLPEPARLTLAKPVNVSDPQWKYLRDLARRLHLDDRSFVKLVRHITGLDDPAWLDVPKARALIAGLKRIEAAPANRRSVPARGNPARPR
jgi:hypothetical protein